MRYRLMRRKLFIVIMIILGGLLILISWQNMQVVTLKFIAWERPVPIILLIYLTFFGGFLFGLLYSQISHAFTRFKKLKDKHIEKRAKKRKEKKTEMAANSDK
ncbi:MAG: lipopolysaccharide assembly protein LapA domain-containing protein [Leptospirales bacterium]|nr:lipopolysaccharide assembly protein LapA domain-containing protein [Leptospirales bacterium]